MHKVTKKDWGAPTKQKKKHRVVFRIFLKYRNFAAELKIITMEFTGKIIAILQPRGGVSKTGNEWKSQEYVIENHDQYPRKMCFDVFGADKIEQFNIQMGEELTVSFDVDARQWQDRWFNSIRAWKVERVGAGAPMTPGAPVPPPAPTAAPEFIAGDAKDLICFMAAASSEAGTTCSPAATAVRLPSWYCLRQRNSWLAATPCCRATRETVIPGSKLC